MVTTTTTQGQEKTVHKYKSSLFMLCYSTLLNTIIPFLSLSSINPSVSRQEQESWWLKREPSCVLLLLYGCVSKGLSKKEPPLTRYTHLVCCGKSIDVQVYKHVHTIFIHPSNTLVKKYHVSQRLLGWRQQKMQIRDWGKSWHLFLLYIFFVSFLVGECVLESDWRR